MLSLALAGLRARGPRTLLSALGILAASLVVGTGVTVGYGLATGFERSADRAGLPDVIARFDPERRETVDERVRALPNLAAASYRYEVLDAPLTADGHHNHRGAVNTIGEGRRGYEILEGRDIAASRPGEAVVEQGLAREWDLHPGDRIRVGRELGELTISGISNAPDNVAFPLATTARVYVSDATIRERLGFTPGDANVALLWLRDPSKADVTLTQARAVSFGLGKLEFVTREGVRVLLSQAAGIVISLLVAFSLVALVAAGTMLAAGAHAEVQRRLSAFGVQRALGFTPGRIAALQAVEAALVAAPAALAGLAIGTLAVAGRSGELLAALNERPPGGALALPLALAFLAVLAVVVAAATWPAWRAARRPPADILRGGDVRPLRPGREARGGLLGLGARFSTAARGRFLASVATIAVCAGVVVLMLALASLLERLRDDPGTVGKRYQLTVRAPDWMLGAIRDVPGVDAAGERYATEAADSFRLGEQLKLVAYPGDHTEFEAPPLAEGRRVRAPDEIEVGLGLADALGLRPGSTVAAQLRSGAEVRFRVTGIVRALESSGRIGWVQPQRLLEGDPDLRPGIVVRLAPGADRAQVTRDLVEIGAPPRTASAATTRNGDFLAVLAAVLRGVGLAVGLVCLYALVQALTMTARERRGAVALLRACGGDARAVATVLAGAAAAVALPAALAGIALEWAVFGPLVARLAAGFASLPLAPAPGHIAIVLLGLLALTLGATALVARRVLREPVIAGLREE
jgi:ABC-type antimicrobial peptide transport system permease subunit